MIVAIIAALTLGVLPARASDTPAQSQIRTALIDWMEDFNAGRADKVCALFAPNLIVDFRGVPERGFAAQCELLRRALSDRARRFTYAVDIKEIIVAGDVALVRLVWTSTLRSQGRPDVVTVEPGMDFFRRQPDGSWRIERYMAYER
jgi:steroid delta-isomerase